VRHIRLETCGSTNDEAKRRLGEGLVPPFLVSTAEQTAGRGREGRSWSQPRGNFAGSFALRPEPPLADAPGLASLLSGLAVTGALQTYGASEAALEVKWPNDVLLGERKVAGILSEMLEVEGRRVFLIGIGVNLAHPPREARFPAAAAFPPGQAPEEEAFGDRLGEALQELFGFTQRSGTAALLGRYRAKAWRIGQRLTVGSGPAALTGVFEDVDEHGRLLLRMADGALRTISAGDVAHG
jgi:BirA family biotin operon repressor/biotin-[acetyl-CoA-carboxylase] ligase